ncbi:2-C-methyl-D-erythritol 4-phosphate cytidylyltransferase [Sphingobacterium kyonggiense]|uniref:2-C-methyl-D-erythritol 4-phosphate cytidylyltransferase n=1 Tax=Sphingobacterium kyonggiense TaxID=714075 RepID=A0ABP7Y5I3_9SPHI
MENRYVIIVAAGTGSRIGGNLPKQYVPINGKPILMHTIEKFYHSETKPEIVVVIAKEMENLWSELCQKHGFQIPHHLCFGGESRFQSVKNGIDYIHYEISAQSTEGVIAIHDAARPFLSSKLIDALFLEVEKGNKAVIPAIKSSSSVRIGTRNVNSAMDRESVWLIQTPQVFDAFILKAAYKQQENPEFTDDASVVEKMSNNILILPGEHENMKITFESDLAIAQLLLM